MPTSGIPIGELAKRTTLTVDTIRFYEKRHLLPKVPAQLLGFGCTPQMISNEFNSFGDARAWFLTREIGELIDLRTIRSRIWAKRKFVPLHGALDERLFFWGL